MFVLTNSSIRNQQAKKALLASMYVNRKSIEIGYFFFAEDGIKCSRKRIYISKNYIIQIAKSEKYETFCVSKLLIALHKDHKGWFSLAHKHKHKLRHSHKHVTWFVLLVFMAISISISVRWSSSSSILIVVAESWYRGILLTLRLHMLLCLCSGLLTCFLTLLMLMLMR